MFGFFFFLMVALYVVTSYFTMKMFQKAGVQGNWRAWVPIYNTMIFFKLGDLSPWLVLYAMAGVVALSWIGIGFIFSILLTVASALASYRVGLKLQKEPIWILLYVLVPVVWFGILGLDKSRWNPWIAPASWATNGFLADRTVWEGVPIQVQEVANQFPPQPWDQQQGGPTY